MNLHLDFPLQIGYNFRSRMINNFRNILNSYNQSLLEEERHRKREPHAHHACQIDYRHTNLSQFLDQLHSELDHMVVGANGDGQAELKQAQVSMDGTTHELLQNRLVYDFTKIQNQLDTESQSIDDIRYLWHPNAVPSYRLGDNKVPNDNNPEHHLAALLDPLVDGKYVTKTKIGEDQSETWNVYKYTFEPETYGKTLLVTACIHGNETTGFYDMCYIADQLVNHWEKAPQLRYLRKNVRLIFVPMVNPWGFANKERENVNNVDLNRNFDFNWESGDGTVASEKNYKGTEPFSEAESKNMRDLVQSLDHLTAHLDLHDIISVANDYCMFYPRWAQQSNNRMASLIHALSDTGDLVVWGSSTVASFSNWVGVEMKTTSYLSEFNEGRVGEKKGVNEMWRSVRWVGNVIFRLAQLEAYQQGQTSLDPFMKVFIYDDRFNDKNSEEIVLRSEQDEWQRIMMTQQRFKATANGFVELYGYITINTDRDVKVGVNPNIIQNYNPFFNKGKSLDRNLFTLEHVLNKGNTTLPIYAAAGVQMSCNTNEGANRPSGILPILDLKKADQGIVKIKQIKLFVKFTPTNTANAIQILKSGDHGNLKEDTFSQIYPNTTFDDDIKNYINEE
ncbi:M14 family metallopeptidase [Staphylococcus auricularis]|uniref:M14 family metallopeptidase n=1 Tax=Staphylococcus auricularis TaxID=29379 RepID=UPI00242BD86F|nr:M14 family metallopeptidase [Staphylococcus auricularis]